MWQMKTEVIPVVVGAPSTIKKSMVENIKGVSERASCDRDPKHEHAGICTNPSEGA